MQQPCAQQVYGFGSWGEVIPELDPCVSYDFNQSE